MAVVVPGTEAVPQSKQPVVEPWNVMEAASTEPAPRSESANASEDTRNMRGRITAIESFGTSAWRGARHARHPRDGKTWSSRLTQQVPSFDERRRPSLTGINLGDPGISAEMLNNLCQIQVFCPALPNPCQAGRDFVGLSNETSAPAGAAAPTKGRNSGEFHNSGWHDPDWNCVPLGPGCTVTPGDGVYEFTLLGNGTLRLDRLVHGRR